jgi:hypothetical protein
LTISNREAGSLTTASLNLAGGYSLCRPDEFELGGAGAYLVEREGAAGPILSAGRMNNDAQPQALGRAAHGSCGLELLAGVVAHAAIMAARYSADFTVRRR